MVQRSELFTFETIVPYVMLLRVWFVLIKLIYSQNV